MRRTDIDGTTLGLVVSVIVDMEHGGSVVSVDRYSEEDYTNPHQSAWAVWTNIEDDWPGCTHLVAANPRAKFLAWQRRMRSLGFADEGINDYLELENSK